MLCKLNIVDYNLYKNRIANDADYQVSIKEVTIIISDLSL